MINCLFGMSGLGKRKSVPSFISGLPATAINSNLRGLCKTESVWKINLFLLLTVWCQVGLDCQTPKVSLLCCARSYTCSSQALGLLPRIIVPFAVSLLNQQLFPLHYKL